MGKLKSEALKPGGSVYEAMHDKSSRLITSAVLTCVMLLVATGLSFFLPTAMVLMVLFAPGVLTMALGGALPKMHYAYGLSQNQRLAIEAYMEADESSKRDFPARFVDTVRNANNPDDQLELAKAAQTIVKLQRKRLDTLDLRDDNVAVALTVMKERATELSNDIKARKELEAPVETPSLESLRKGYNRYQDR